MAAILPPATIGILGGGQLGRMTALAARSLGYRVQVLDPDADCSARPVVDRVVVANFDDADGARELARASDVVTIEIEQIAPAALSAALEFAPVRPGAELLRVIQHRGRQKRWLADNGFPVGAHAHVDTAQALASAASEIGPALFVKACEGGYDGRSQLRFDGADADAAWRSLGGRPAVAEQALDLELELSVMVARRAPGELPPEVARDARDLACGIAERFALEGILAVEMFLVRDGRLLVNELAPRPHNSYHASELACPTSQFEQLVRAVCDLPLGLPEPTRPAAIVNLFGDLWLDGRAPRFSAALEVPGTRLFLYGKHGARAGRKMGHLAAIGDSPADARERVRSAAERL